METVIMNGFVDNLTVDEIEPYLLKLFVSDNEVYIWRKRSNNKLVLITPWERFKYSEYEFIVGMCKDAPNDLDISREQYIKSIIELVKAVLLL